MEFFFLDFIFSRNLRIYTIVGKSNSKFLCRGCSYMRTTCLVLGNLVRIQWRMEALESMQGTNSKPCGEENS